MTRFAFCHFFCAFLGLGGAACPQPLSQLSPEHQTEAWLAATSSRAPLEVRTEAPPEHRACELPEFPDSGHTWSTDFFRGNVVEVVNQHPLLGADAPRWVFGPSNVVNDGDASGLYAAALWEGSAPITCGGESVEGAIVVLDTAFAIENLGLLSREEIREKMAKNVEREGLEAATEDDFATVLCPDTEQGCDG